GCGGGSALGGTCGTGGALRRVGPASSGTGGGVVAGAGGGGGLGGPAAGMYGSDPVADAIAPNDPDADSVATSTAVAIVGSLTDTIAAHVLQRILRILPRTLSSAIE